MGRLAMSVETTTGEAEAAPEPEPKGAQAGKAPRAARVPAPRRAWRWVRAWPDPRDRSTGWVGLCAWLSGR